MKKVLVVAPHPDDETLGCGGVLLRHKAQDDRTFWLVMTAMHGEHGFAKERVDARAKEIEEVAKRYGFGAVFNLALPTGRLDTFDRGDLIGKISAVFKEVEPEIVYLPYPGDAHSDHKITFEAVRACTKWFRYESVRRVLVYETISETEHGITPDGRSFCPNVFVDVTPYLDQKIQIMSCYEGEMGRFPFPRSETALRALAQYRGATAGVAAAEAFMLLKERL